MIKETNDPWISNYAMEKTPKVRQYIMEHSLL